jgi:hypothetical protein
LRLRKDAIVIRLGLIGQQRSGSAMLEAFLARGDVVAAIPSPPKPAQPIRCGRRRKHETSLFVSLQD